ncbi:methylenetetrahydrofolate reductase [NAD(P)H] [Leucothrix pacifica]|uniref:Methylenetetrahydrofolate reductase n=1 Tax=Leucothrix pacifica TaxID=1247513 RepID=A0A317CBS3_9GAMM|nr:methylenetetrahydrofolate reductase [NAD(P)H] [Leucothrix pacifica]PWQ95819.1 methylenetetrahydrofolate reductase [NAD(P)H] [Leucothrix pacifica]
MAKHVSFEFFPAKTEKGKQNILSASKTLSSLKPEFFSVTFGAGGSDQQTTFDTVLGVQNTSGIATASHLTCVGSSRERIGSILDNYKANNINRLVALRGDLPMGMDDPGEFQYANELVSFIREHSGDYFHIEVAAYPEKHPQSIDHKEDLNNFVQKVKAGADSAITQYFYNPDGYSYFVDECMSAGLDIPIIPGIMPIGNFESLSRFSDACGAEIPRWLRIRLESYEHDPVSLTAFTNDYITEMCVKLIEQGAPGLHFYSMNKVEPNMQICKAVMAHFPDQFEQ